MKLRNKLLICFSACLFLIALTSTLVSNRIYQSEIFQDRKDEYAVMIHQMQSSIELTAKDIETSFVSLYTSSGLVSTIRDSTSPETTRERDIKSKLRYICFENANISATAFSDKDGVLYSVVNSTSSDDKQLTQVILTNHQRLDNNYTVWFSDESGRIYLKKNIYAVTPLYYCGYLVAEISDDIFLNNMGLQNASTRSGSIAVFSSEGDLLLINGKITRKDAIRIQQEILQDCTQFEGVVEYNGNDYYLQCESANHSWMIFHIISMSDMKALPNRVSRINLLVFLCIFLAFIPVVCFSSNTLTKGIKHLHHAMTNVSNGDFSITIQSSSKDEIGELTKHFQVLVNQLKEYMNLEILHATEKEQAEYTMLEIKYRSLQSQINPHFISNILTAINAQAAMGKTKEVSNLSILAGQYFRENLRKSDEKFTTLDREIHYVQDYLAIFRCIYGDHVSFSLECSEECLAVSVPNMILQPLVENTLIHGGLNISQNDYRICLSAKLSDNCQRVFLSLSDNGMGISDDVLNELKHDLSTNNINEKGKSFGLRGVCKRLFLLYKENQSFEIQSSENGTCISFSFPACPDQTDDMRPND